MRRPRSRLATAVLAGLTALAVLPATAAPGRAAEPIEIAIDIAHILKLDRPAGTVIIGNPNIADATILDARTFVLTGKTSGLTNLIVLDQNGEGISDYAVRVTKGDGNYVNVRAGDRQRTFFCNGVCDSRPVGKGMQGTPSGDLASILALAALAVRDAEAGAGEAQADGDAPAAPDAPSE